MLGPTHARRSARAPTVRSRRAASGAVPGGQAGEPRLHAEGHERRRRVRLADYKGKVILLNFWATWCGPCKVEIPEFIELYAQYKDKGFVILGISVDDTPETLRDVRGGVQDELSGARRTRRGEADRCVRAALRLCRPRSSSGATGRSAAGTSGRRRRRRSSGRSRRSCSMIACTMLKGFTHARLACGCRIGFREGVEGSPVTVVVDQKGARLPADAARARSAALRLPRGAAPVDAPRCRRNEEEYEES